MVQGRALRRAEPGVSRVAGRQRERDCLRGPRRNAEHRELWVFCRRHSGRRQLRVGGEPERALRPGRQRLGVDGHRQWLERGAFAAAVSRARHPGSPPSARVPMWIPSRQSPARLPRDPGARCALADPLRVLPAERALPAPSASAAPADAGNNLGSTSLSVSSSESGEDLEVVDLELELVRRREALRELRDQPHHDCRGAALVHVCEQEHHALTRHAEDRVVRAGRSPRRRSAPGRSDRPRRPRAPPASK